MERVMITVPEELLSQVDQLAAREGQNRSQLIRQALTDLLDRKEREAFEALLAAGYQELAAAARDAAEDGERAQVEAAAGVWTWEESAG
jgi:CopG family transcriptional regulator / antitoxin EndoAI